jgi:glycosyltransferase involved in cell wall biosynthesis
MQGWPISVIPNLIDTDTFKPILRQIAREVLNLPQESKLILFGAIGGTKDPNKGWDLLESALRKAAKDLSNAEAVIFGELEPQRPPLLGMPMHWMGHLHDDATLALLYSAADALVVPSRQENLPQCGTEAQACGCPVVAFDATGLRDVVEHKKTGYLARPYDTEDLATGIIWVLSDKGRHADLSRSARKRALLMWSGNIVLPKYLDIYKQVIVEHKKDNQLPATAFSHSRSST